MTAVQPDLILAGQVLAVLGPAAAVVFFGSFFGHVVVALNKQKPMTWSYVAVAVIAVTGYVLFVPRYGAWGAAWVTLVAEVCITILSFLMVRLNSGIKLRLAMFMRAILASMAMAAAIVVIPLPHIFISIAMGMAVYAVVLTLLGGPKPQDILKLFSADKPPITP